MEFRSTTAAATLVIGALTLGAAPAHAQQPETPNLAYSTTLVDKTVVTVLRGGTFELSKGTRLEDGGVERLTERDGTLVRADGSAADPARTVDIVDVKDATGAVAVALPLDFRFGEVSVPVRPALDEDDTVLRLTPEKPAGLDISQPLAVKPVASEVENQRALNNLATHFGLATAIGGFVGTAIGATIGCVATLVAGCIGGLATGASVGGIIGTIVAGGPALIATGIEYLTTVQAPDGTTRWADKPKPQTAAPAQAEPAK
ncbi:Uncharacterised protein [Nocardia otitidiscaviarum]|uniref:DUF8020 domain-containing protein n=1 Tax=Nocardia otitidiscaviarum TaxID=1823 RepID=A0A378YNL2_9NOCA|nr:hypothetical protein [Nocardia otitidiscaviarum]SUA78170.1 Uncharacterised protein [Nocardia otitidiscaviarum]